MSVDYLQAWAAARQFRSEYQSLGLVVGVSVTKMSIGSRRGPGDSLEGFCLRVFLSTAGAQIPLPKEQYRGVPLFYQVAERAHG